MDPKVEQEFKQWVHWFAGVLGTAFMTYLTVPSVQDAVNKAVAGHPKISAALVTITGIAVAYIQSKKNKTVTAAIILFIILASAAIPAHATCGTERWDVKTLADSAAAHVLAHSPVTSSVTQLRQLESPSSWSNTLPRQDAENQTYSVRAWVLGYKLEGDQDYHVVLSEVGDKTLTMIAEIPSPECVPKYADKFTFARLQLAHIHKPTAKGKMVWFSSPQEAKIVGVLFFDKPHGQTGLAPNAVELHPILSILFLPASGCAPSCSTATMPTAELAPKVVNW